MEQQWASDRHDTMETVKQKAATHRTVDSWSGTRTLGKWTHATENLNTQRWVCIQLLPKLEIQDELEPFQLALIASRVSEIKEL